MADFVSKRFALANSVSCYKLFRPPAELYWLIVAPSAHSTLRASPYVRYVAGECFLGSEETSMPQQLTAYGGELHHAFGVTRRHASRVCFVRLSLREGPIADGMRAHSI